MAADEQILVVERKVFEQAGVFRGLMFDVEPYLRQLFADQKASPESTIITYCGTGVWASPVYFAARFLGYRVRFYDGSFQEWSGDESLPVSKTATGPQNE